MGNFSKILSDESGLLWYSLAGMIIFITLFVVMLYKVIKMPRKTAEQIKESILEETSNDSN